MFALDNMFADDFFIVIKEVASEDGVKTFVIYE